MQVRSKVKSWVDISASTTSHSITIHQRRLGIEDRPNVPAALAEGADCPAGLVPVASADSLTALSHRKRG
jgi:hypothetical protein